MISISMAMLVVFVSNAKYATLHEPLVFSDLSLIPQLLRYPRLYFPFVSRGIAWRPLLITLSLLFSFKLDTPLSGQLRVWALLLGTVATGLMLVLARSLQLQMHAVADQARFGFFASFYAGLCNGLRPTTIAQLARQLELSGFKDAKPQAHAELLPDVLLIQSESFFDARRLGPEVRPELLQHFDRARRQALAWGDLHVPAYGANTMRTEFAVLSGLTLSQQAYAAYYPYSFIRRPVPSLARWYREQGYQTCFIHPYYADFFGRQRVMPCLGFQQFIDIQNFADQGRDGPYISDAAVAEQIMAQLDACAAQAKPAFIMAVTMENHGPLHLEQVSPGESAGYHSFGESPELDDLTAYLRHLAHADAMLGRLLAYLTSRARPTVVCFYGDHVPALSEVFAYVGKPQSVTDYFIWRSDCDHSASAPACALSADALGRALIQASALAVSI